MSTAADMKGTLGALVRSRMGDFTASERRVARVFLAGYPTAGLESVAHLARRAGVSAPTVLRFVSKLGFRGYAALQQALRAEIHEKLTSALELYERGPIEPDEKVLAHCRETFANELDATLVDLPPSEFEAVVDLLSDERRSVLCTGGRFSQVLAFYLAAHVTMMRPGCRYVAASPTPRFDELIDVGRRTVVVTFDYRRYQTSTIEFARRAAQRGATVVLFTDPWMSPIAVVARHVLCATIVAPSPFDSLVPALAVVEAVIAGLSVRIGPKARDRMMELERLRAGTTWSDTDLGLVQTRDGAPVPDSW